MGQHRHRWAVLKYPMLLEGYCNFRRHDTAQRDDFHELCEATRDDENKLKAPLF